MRKALVCLVILASLLLLVSYGCRSTTDWYAKGAAEMNRRRYEQAINYFDKAIKLNPTYSEALVAKGDCLYSLERYDEAVICYGKANWNLVKNHKDAFESYQKTLEKNPDNPDLLAAVGDFLQEQRKFDEAIKSYDKAILINPRNFRAWSGKYWSLYFSGRREEAARWMLEGQQGGVF